MDLIVEAAFHAFEQGWSPVPILKGTKRPAHSDWTTTRYKTKNEIESAFKDSNLGVLLGDASNGLIDIDLDSPEAEVLADGFLPMTRMIHGRESSLRSHYWYRVEDWAVKVKPFYDPIEYAKMNSSKPYTKDRLVLLEIRGNGGQTLLPPSTHVSGEKYKWLGGWHSPSVVSYKEIEKQVRWLAAAALLARYWPGEGKRHAASMALSGGLLKSGDEELTQDAEAFVASVALAAQDEEGMDRQQDVETSRKMIKAGKKVRGWPSLAKLMPKVVVMQAMNWLTPPEETDPGYSDGTMVRQSLKDYMIGEIDPPAMMVKDLLYEGKVHWFQGEPGGGKTIFALWLSGLCIQNGYRVMMIDEESGPNMTGERMAGLKLDPDLVESNFFYYPFSSVNVMDPDHRQSFNEALKESTPNIIIFDSVSDILSQAGLKENDNDDINSLIKHFVDPLRTQNVSTFFIDHMTKSNLEGGWARGAGSKKSKADLAWTFTATKAFDRETMGRVSVKRAKDRLGRMPLTQLYRMGGDGQGGIVIEATQVSKEVVSVEDEYAQRIVDYLREHAKTEDESLKTKEIVTQVSGDTNSLYKAINWLQDNLAETPIEMVTRGKTRLWFYAGELEIDFEWANTKDKG